MDGADLDERLLKALLRVDPDALVDLLDGLSPAEVAAVLDLLDGYAPVVVNVWEPLDHQRPPDGDWWAWLMLAGRGAGKTAAAAHWLDHEARTRPKTRWAIVAPTLGDARRTCVEGESGLLSVNPTVKFNRSKYEVTWPNGSVAYLYGAYRTEDRLRLRGPQFHGAWGDEFAAWRQLDERPHPEDPDIYQQLEIACRLGDDPQVCLTTTPKRRAALLELVGRDGADVAVTTARMVDNIHLSDAYRERLLARYAGTRLGAQELDGLIIDEVEDALLSYVDLDGMLDRSPPPLPRRIVSVDPAATYSDRSDEFGIIVAGATYDGDRPRGWTLADLSGKYPIVGDEGTWAHVAVEAFHDYECEAIVAEVNNGGEHVKQGIHVVDPDVPVKMLRASVGKRARAEPVAQVARMGRWFHAAAFPELREQWATYSPDDDESPDRLDAEVWAVTHLALGDRSGRLTPPSSARGRSSRTTATRLVRNR